VPGMAEGFGDLRRENVRAGALQEPSMPNEDAHQEIVGSRADGEDLPNSTI
jgi:hypothetical protein